MRDLGTDHVISGPMSGLDKNCIRWSRQTADKQTDGHRNYMTDPAQRAESVKMLCKTKLHCDQPVFSLP